MKVICGISSIGQIGFLIWLKDRFNMYLNRLCTVTYKYYDRFKKVAILRECNLVRVNNNNNPYDAGNIGSLTKGTCDVFLQNKGGLDIHLGEYNILALNTIVGYSRAIVGL